MTASAPARNCPGLVLLSSAAAAILGGYALTSAATIFLAAILPMPKAEAVLASTLLSFAVYIGVVVWVFAEHNIRKVWAWLVGATVLLVGVGMLLSRVLA